MRFISSVVKAALAFVGRWLGIAYLTLFAVDEIAAELGKWIDKRIMRPARRVVFDRRGRIVKLQVGPKWIGKRG